MNGDPDQEVGAVSCFVKYENKCGHSPARMMALEDAKCKSNIFLTFNFSKFGPKVLL